MAIFQTDGLIGTRGADNVAVTMEKYSSRIRIGTSGWVYKEWADDFYRGLKPPEHFPYYASQFSTVEINATFYRLPDLKMVRGWREKAPASFIFAVKGSRFITHIKRLSNLGGALNRFMRRITPLQPKLGPLLWQLPPNLKLDLPRLRQFVRRLNPKFSHAVEFRDPSWIIPEVKELLQGSGIALVWLSSLRMPVDFSVTAGFVYIRFHGLEGGARHDYTEAELAPWAAQIRRTAGMGKEVYAYFNNDLNVRAPNNAKLLKKLCGVE